MKNRFLFIMVMIFIMFTIFGCTPLPFPNQPNLVVLGVDKFSKECVVGPAGSTCTHTIVFTVSNIGLSEAGPFEVLVKIDPKLSQQIYVLNMEGLEAMNSITLTAIIEGANCFDPDCNIEIQVDSMEVVDEYDEDDNIYTENIIG